MKAAAVVYVEPEFVNDRGGAAMLAVSPRTFAKFVKDGKVTAIKVPDMRRVVYDVASIRALANSWRQKHEDREPGVMGLAAIPRLTV